MRLASQGNISTHLRNLKGQVWVRDIDKPEVLGCSFVCLPACLSVGNLCHSFRSSSEWHNLVVRCLNFFFFGGGGGGEFGRLP